MRTRAQIAKPNMVWLTGMSNSMALDHS